MWRILDAPYPEFDSEMGKLFPDISLENLDEGGVAHILFHPSGDYDWAEMYPGGCFTLWIYNKEHETYWLDERWFPEALKAALDYWEEQ